MSTTAETLEFKAELKQLLHLITHSLYSDREIFLRELISNASDAINKIKFDSLDHQEKLEDDKDWKIVITPDKEAKTLTIADNGVGMSKEEVIDNLGTIAKSGTRAFLDAAKAKQQEKTDLPGLIGQFGVGFYSAFMVADRVTVRTRPAGEPDAGVEWNSDGQGEFSIEPTIKPGRGTEVILHLKEDAQDYVDPYKLESIVKKFSDFVEHPVILVTTEEVEGKTETKEETVNSRKAIWRRMPNEVTEEEYNEFYKTISHDFSPPAKTLHFKIEGKTEFRALLFIPPDKPFSFDYQEQKGGLKLYVQRVLIMDECEQLLPQYLRFVKGVVDSSDLPLNVSRELLQRNPHLDTIRKNIVRNIFSGLEGMRNVAYEKYVKFYQGLGGVLKEGLARDFENKEKVADLLLFETANGENGKYVKLAEYVEKMPEGQEKIYYLTGESAEQLRHSPYMELFRAKGYDVLLMTDPIDEFAIPHLHKYKQKELEQADRSDLKPNDDELPPEVTTLYANLLAKFREYLPEVKDVKLTQRLTESASCLVAEDNAMGAHMERILKRAGQFDGDASKRVLELNPNNAAIGKVRELFDATPSDERIKDYARLFYEQAVIAEGSRLSDPVGFAQRVNKLIVGA